MMDTRTSTLRKRLSIKIAASLLLVVGLGSLLALTQVASASSNVHGFENGSLEVRFEGGNRGPVLDVAGAYPGMPARSSEIVLKNSGSLPAGYTVASTHVTGSLDRALRLVVSDQATGRNVYSGRLSGLSFSGTADLQPGQSATYVARISWPSTAHVGGVASVSFDMQLVARDATR